MIGKVVTGSDVRGLLRYLYGPGRVNEHTDPHLAGAWTDPHRVEPVRDERGRRDLSRLVTLLEAPVAASARVPEAPVWHCALRAAPGDRRLSDGEWDDVAREVMDRTGLSPRGDTAGCRWVAVRDAEDHVHLVVTLARQDGRAVSTFRDFYRVGEACRAVEDRYALTVTPARDRTAAKRPTRAETEKAHRAGRVEPPRVTLAREVRYAAVAATTEDESSTACEPRRCWSGPGTANASPGGSPGTPSPSPWTAPPAASRCGSAAGSWLLTCRGRSCSAGGQTRHRRRRQRGVRRRTGKPRPWSGAQRTLCVSGALASQPPART